jgi:hypothetical protein
MTDLDPQTTADFWDAYVTVADSWSTWYRCRRVSPAAVNGHLQPIQLWNRPSGS